MGLKIKAAGLTEIERRLPEAGKGMRVGERWKWLMGTHTQIERTNKNLVFDSKIG